MRNNLQFSTEKDSFKQMCIEVYVSIHYLGFLQLHKIPVDLVNHLDEVEIL